MHRKSKQVLPANNNLEDLCEEFADFFAEKIVKIRLDLEKEVATGNISTTKSGNQVPTINHELNKFHAVTEEYIEKLVNNMATKSCELDAMPTWLLKESLDILLPTLTTIVNLSLEQSTVPMQFKKALLKPLIKKSMLDPNIMKHYRPVSNMDFISKLLEKVVADQLETHLSSNNLYEHLQSAYRRYHSTETALLKVSNDVLKVINDDNVCLLVLLDLSAAFDTIDHGILLERLQNQFHICGTALDWITSYLRDRKQTVAIENITSRERNPDFGIPQGSVLGPLLSTLYTVPLSDII